MEILAPCGNEESFYSAIYNGADAIYLGLGDFNARAKATFFTTENIREYVKIAHLFGVKIYVTTNTLLKDEEIPAFIKFAQKCIEAKVDAFIVQDLGVAKILRECFPNCELHASTQMGICNVQGAMIAKQLGFSRVVLSRETKLEDIKEIKQKTGLEIEYFVQGALCVAFSGNCYLSALNNNQSGNRGKCLQLCRLPYSAYLNNELLGKGYLLSARDLCLIENLQELKSAGVDSLKIEGRLRRAGYVAQSVASYRLAVDALGNNSKINLKPEILKLKKVFSRGDYNTRAYLDAGVPDNIINSKIQNHLGIEIGEVLDVQPFKDLFKIKLKSTHPLHQNDGLKFLDNVGNEVASAGVGNVEIIDKNTYIFYTKNHLRKGLKVYLTCDSENEKLLTLKTKKINIDATLIANENEQLELTFFTTIKNHKISANLKSDYVCPKAQNAPTSKEEIFTQINKLNDTYFALDNLEIKTNGSVFIPKSILNNARRESTLLLCENIIKNAEGNIKCTVNQQNIDILCKKTQDIKLELNNDINNIYIINEETDLSKLQILENDVVAFSPTIYTEENVLRNIEKISKNYNKIALDLPIIANGKDMQILQNIIDKLDNKIMLILSNISGIIFANTTRKTIAGLGLNIYNNLSVLELEKLNVNYFIFSKELTPKNEKFITFGYGKQSLMTFAHCPFKTLFHNSCKDCKFSKNLVIKGTDGKVYDIQRTIISQCYFTLYQNKIFDNKKPTKNLIDLRF